MTRYALDGCESLPTSEQLRAALKRSASALKADGVPFALAGSYALWVHGAPESMHDVDLVVAESSGRAGGRKASAQDGFRIERPPEDWLFKAYLDGAMVDVLHRLNGCRSMTSCSSAPRSPRCSGCGSRCCRRPR